MKTLTIILAVTFLAAISIPTLATVRVATDHGTFRTAKHGHNRGGALPVDPTDPSGNTRHRANGCNVGVRFHPTRSCIYDRWGNLMRSGRGIGGIDASGNGSKH